MLVFGMILPPKMLVVNYIVVTVTCRFREPIPLSDSVDLLGWRGLGIRGRRRFEEEGECDWVRSG